MNGRMTETGEIAVAEIIAKDDDEIGRSLHVVSSEAGKQQKRKNERKRRKKGIHKARSLSFIMAKQASTPLKRNASLDRFLLCLEPVFVFDRCP